MSPTESANNEQVPTLLLKDSKGSDLLCYLEQVVPIEGIDYALLTPVDTPCLLYTSPSPRDKRQSRMPSSA